MKKMKKIINYFISNWYKLLAEILVIIIGILMAFSLQNFSEKQRTDSYLKSMNTELELNIELINRYMQSIESALDTTFDYLQLVNNSDFINDSTLLEMISHLGPLGELSLSRVASDDIINSGLLEFIDNEELRKQILGLGVSYDLLEFHVIRARNQWINEMLPYFHIHSNLMNMRDSIGIYSMPKSRYKNDLTAYLDNREFSNLITVHMLWVSNVTSSCVSRIEILEKLNNELKMYLE